MGFSTTVFLFLFLPLALIFYFISDFLEKKVKVFQAVRLKDGSLFLISLAFYSWACADYIVWLPLYILFIYFLGVVIQATQNLYIQLPVYRRENENFQCLPMLRIGTGVFVLAVFATVLILFRYKYADFINNNLSILKIHVSGGLIPLAPLGISFIIFSSVSYLADIRNRKAERGNFLDCAIYISFFPKIISGPITLWRDFEDQIRDRHTSLDRTVDGFNRICIGFAKKVLLADFFGRTIAEIGSKGGYGIDTITVWICALLYMLQIYYDFAGYSDIAIGLSGVLGFDLKENFHFPYRSLSITEFWRRWHISLGTWFREYIYIPLGGNRKGQTRTLINLGIVFLLTGIWHGAGWNYILWGSINGVIMIWERTNMKKPLYQKIPSPVKWAGTMFVVLLFWQLFRYQTVKEAWGSICAMFTPTAQPVTFTWKFFLDPKLMAMMTAGILGATVLGCAWVKDFWIRIRQNVCVIALQEIVLLLLMVLSIISVVSSTYSPFIYFQY